MILSYDTWLLGDSWLTISSLEHAFLLAPLIASFLIFLLPLSICHDFKELFSHFPVKHPCPPELHLNSRPVPTLRFHWEVPPTSWVWECNNNKAQWGFNLCLLHRPLCWATSLSLYANLPTRWKSYPYLNMPPTEVATFPQRNLAMKDRRESGTWGSGVEKDYGGFYFGKHSKLDERQVEGISGKKEGKDTGEDEFLSRWKD